MYGTRRRDDLTDDLGRRAAADGLPGARRPFGRAVVLTNQRSFKQSRFSDQIRLKYRELLHYEDALRGLKEGLRAWLKGLKCFQAQALNLRPRRQ